MITSTKLDREWFLDYHDDEDSESSTRYSLSPLHEIVQIGGRLNRVSQTDDGGLLVKSPYMRGLCAGTSLLMAVVFAHPVIPAEAHSTRSISNVQVSSREAIEWIRGATGLIGERIAELLGVSRQAVNEWRRGKNITDEHRRRLLIVRSILERAAERYPAPGQLAAWLDTPRRSDGRTPAELIAAGEFDRARYLVVATPSAGLKPMPNWNRGPIPERFRQGAERFPSPAPPESEAQAVPPFVDEDDEPDEVVTILEIDA